MTRWTNFSSLISSSPHPSGLLSKDYGYPRLQKHQSSLAEERDATLQQGSNLEKKKNTQSAIWRTRKGTFFDDGNCFWVSNGKIIQFWKATERTGAEHMLRANAIPVGTKFLFFSQQSVLCQYRQSTADVLLIKRDLISNYIWQLVFKMAIILHFCRITLEGALNRECKSKIKAKRHFSMICSL